MRRSPDAAQDGDATRGGIGIPLAVERDWVVSKARTGATLTTLTALAVGSSNRLRALGGRVHHRDDELVAEVGKPVFRPGPEVDNVT